MRAARAQLPLAAILLAIVLASCGARPGVAVTIDGQRIPMALSSTTQNTCNSTTHGDAFVRPEEMPLTTVRLKPPIILRFQAGTGATAIRGVIYDIDALGSPSGPMEQFTVAGGSGTYETRGLSTGRTYEFLLNVQWSLLVTTGEESHVFRLRIEPP